MSLLDKTMVVSPCSVSWDSMEGDERVRHCSGCSKNVYNLSNMTATEAEILLGQNGERPCLRFYRRPDGTIMTDNCPRALRALRRRMRTAVAIVAGLIGSFEPFSKTRDERERSGDPRLSIAERYSGKQDSLDRVEKAARELVSQRFLLPADVDAVLKRASAMWDAIAQ